MLAEVSRRTYVGTNRKEHRRKRNILDEAFVAAIQQLVDQNAGQSMRSMAKKLGLTESTLQKNISQGIHYKSYALKRASQ